MPMAKGIFQSSVEDVNANVQGALDCMFVPTHLLALVHPLGNDLVDRRLNETSNPRISFNSRIGSKLANWVLSCSLLS
jgi:hypothetical protein